MGWLLRRGEVLASLDVHASTTANGATPDVGALLRREVHFVTGLSGARGFDVAWLDHELVVRSVGHVGRFGLRAAPRACAAVVLAEPGAFERWKLEIGDQLEARE